MQMDPAPLREREEALADKVDFNGSGNDGVIEHCICPVAIGRPFELGAELDEEAKETGDSGLGLDVALGGGTERLADQREGAVVAERRIVFRIFLNEAAQKGVFQPLLTIEPQNT